MHVILALNDGNNTQAWEPVHVRPMPVPPIFEVEYSPGLVQGIAAGDIIQVDEAARSFTMIQRSGNLAIQMFRRTSMLRYFEAIDQRLMALQGRRDGQIESACVFTLPLKPTGFPAIEQVMAGLLADGLIDEWMFGNVYDHQGNPLKWWE